jgi:glucan phosphoethanolaminetransferase (alkaline phosphatase superfamily)
VYFVPTPNMRDRLYRLSLITEFLIAVQVMFTFWSQVGGQSHLDLMFWPWKFGLSILAAALIVAITAGRQPRLALAFLLLTVITAGVVTYYYHVNEPTEPDTDYQDSPAGIEKSSYQTRQPFAPLTIG